LWWRVLGMPRSGPARPPKYNTFSETRHQQILVIRCLIKPLPAAPAQLLVLSRIHQWFVTLTSYAALRSRTRPSANRPNESPNRVP
jgi:hypothetical protein